MNNDITVRFAAPEDAAALVKIYRPYVLETAISFEYEVPSIEEFAQRIRNTQQKYPYLVAECSDGIAGYTYAESFSGRAAYSWSAATTIYVEQNRQKQGIGKKLYETLEYALKEMHICNLNACIAYPETEDEYLTRNSADFHKHLGYKQAGEFHKCGYKFGHWYNVIWMEKIIAEHPQTPSAIINVDEIRGLLRERYRIL